MDTPRTRELAPQIAEMLGDEWTDTPTHHDNGVTTHNITHTNGAAIHLFHDTYRKKLIISGNFPKSDRDNTQFGPYGEDKNKYSIGVNPERTAQSIAKDILRRLLPQYMREYPKTVEKKKAYDARQERKGEIVKEIVTIFGKEPSDKYQVNYQVSLPSSINGYGSVRVDGIDSIRLNLCSMTYEQTMAILFALVEITEIEKATPADCQELF